MPRVELLLHLAQRLAAGEQRVGDGAGDAGGRNAGSGNRRIERHRHELAGIRRARSGDDEQRPGAALPRGHGLVAEVGVAREDRARLLVRVLGEVAQDDDDLVLDVERGVAVVAEVLRLRHHEPVAGEDDRAGDLGVVGERERLHLLPAAKLVGARLRRACVTREPPSRLPAVNSNGTNMSARPGSGRAPMRASCAAM